MGSVVDDDDLADLSESIETVLSPRRRFYDYRQANLYAAEGQWLVQELVEIAPGGTLPVLRLVERAITLTVRTILRSDDSAGIQGDQIRRLLAAHARAAAACAGTLDRKERRRLATWLHRFRFDGRQDFFEVDVDAYADALGPEGVEHYRALVEESARTGAEAFAVEYARVRLAVLDRDPEAIVAALGGEPTAQHQAVDVVGALDDAGLHRHAVGYAERGLTLPSTHQHRVLVDRMVRDAVERGDTQQVLSLRADHFRLRPDSSTLAALRVAAEACGEWEGRRAEAEAHLARYRGDQWIGVLLGEGRDDEAWAFALADPGSARAAQAWPRLCERRALTAPADTLPVYEQLILDTLTQADKRAYQAAALLLLAMRTAADAAGREPAYREFAARTVEDNRRRPTLLRILQQRGVIDGDRAIR